MKLKDLRELLLFIPLQSIVILKHLQANFEKGVETLNDIKCDDM